MPSINESGYKGFDAVTWFGLLAPAGTPKDVVARLNAEFNNSFAVEPMTAPHPFHGEARITLSPHIGGVTADAYVKMGVGAVQNALAVLNR